MSNVYELHHLLHSLVNAWPEHDTNPVVEQARSYLHTLEQTSSHDGHTWDDDHHYESYHDAMWYSI
jgi:hypothetical protein